MRRPSNRTLLGFGIPLLVVVVLLAAWGIGTARNRGRVPRNVTLAERDIGGLDPAALSDTVADIAASYAVLPVQLATPDTTYTVAAGKLGLALDQAATRRAALELDRDASLISRPFRWLASFANSRQAPLKFTVDQATLTKGLAELGGDAEAHEPSLVPATGAIVVVAGRPGRRISEGSLETQLLDQATRGKTSISLVAQVQKTDPTITDADAKALADRLNLATANGLLVRAGPHQAALAQTDVRGLLGSKVTDGRLEVTLDAARARAALTEAIPVNTEPKDATVGLVNGTPAVVPSVDGEMCCGEDAPARMLDAILKSQPEVTVDLQIKKAAFTTEAANALGIKEPVGAVNVTWKGQPQVKSFTTYFRCCEARVTNIHRIADLVQGTLVKPGETFSVNQTVGKRTAEKGFVEAGAIANGEHVNEVGGGVSQFATTMFNAAFFAGLPFGEYQAHSEHFDRYPFGREATMGWEHPDLQWKNDTPYGIMVWTSYTDTSVTVTLWSTQHAWGEQTGQSTGRSGNCTTVTTTRTIHRPDGTTATDTVGARYRDRGATRC